jgi:diaminohydroxyphosphoribosylaminopyrimidine deaminase/5-amino-6-(5-phosphoribosylamino)uracil reductase
VDPDPRVSGGGIKTLLAAGVEVVVGCEEAACREINADFIERNT